MTRPRALLRLVLALLPLSAFAEAPAEAPVKVHDHVAYVFRAPAGSQTPAMRAAAASQTLTSAIDQDVPGDVQVVVQGGVADVRLGERLLFRLTADDVRLDGASSLADYAPRLQTDLDSFVTKERKRAHLQHGVLATSLAVFFAVLLFVLLRAFFRATRALENRFERGDAELPPSMRRVVGGDAEQSRGVVLFLLSAARIAVSLGAFYLLLLASLSLFETTRPFRDRLALWAASPFRAMAARVVHGLPNLILLGVLLGVLRAGWQSMSVGFVRMAHQEGPRALKPYQLVPYRLLARVALVTGALLMLPLALGAEMGLFTAIGLVLLTVIGLASLPLLANVGVGVHALLSHQFPLGNWVRVRLPNGSELAGEVTSVDFFHLRLVPEGGGEARVPHLLALWSAVDHLPNARTLRVELAVLRAQLEPRQALAALEAAAARVLAEHGRSGAPRVELWELTPELARFRVSLPDAGEALRTPLLLALSALPSALPEPLREPGGPLLVEPARAERASGGEVAGAALASTAKRPAAEEP